MGKDQNLSEAGGTGDRTACAQGCPVLRLMLPVVSRSLLKKSKYNPTKDHLVRDTLAKN